MRRRRRVHRFAHVSLTCWLAAIVSCSDGAVRHRATPTSADGLSSISETAAAPAADDVVDRSQPPVPGRPEVPANVSADVNFPPRDQALAFRQELEATYRDVLRRPATSSFVDIEG